MIRSIQRQFMGVLLALGFWAGMQGSLSAQYYYPAAPYNPVPYGYVPYPYPPPGPFAPVAAAQPAMPPVPAQACRRRRHRSRASRQRRPPRCTGPAAPDDGSLPMAPMDGAVASGHEVYDPFGSNKTVAAIDMLGHAEFFNRLNMFENMTALPTNRVWGGYENLQDFQTGFGNYKVPGLPLTQPRSEDLYRGGAEIAIGNLFSFTAQAEYVSSIGSQSNQDAWANPWFALKWAAIFTECTVVSPVLAFQPGTSQSYGEVHDRGARVYPGMLFFQSFDNCFFLQGGCQFGIAAGSGGGANTADYGLSFGMWLYRHDSLDVAGCLTDSFERTTLPLCTGIVPQLELWGTNVINGAGRAPIDPNEPGMTDSYLGFNQGQNVYDMSVGCRFLFINHMSLGLGYCFPLSGAYVFKNEFTTTFNVSF